MEERSPLEKFLYKLYTYLTDEQSDGEIKIFRKHNNNLNNLGDFSFPLNLSGWQKCTKVLSNTKILQYINKFENHQLTEADFEDLIADIKKWNILCINKIKLSDNKVNVFFQREKAFDVLISKILSEKERYGLFKLQVIPIVLKIEDLEEKNTDLTSLRLTLIKNVTINIVNSATNSLTQENLETIYLTTKSNSECMSKKIVCGVVISNKLGKKNTNISAQQYYEKRTVDMQLMAQHKYGLRVNSEPGWKEYFKHLGDAAVTIDLLHVKSNRPIIINENCASNNSSKGASFILYNCARLAEIFKKFEEKVKHGDIGTLPDIREINFNLLNQSEEWELLFVYLMQYETTVLSCVQDISNCRLNIHNLCIFLDSLCSTFSIYYRRVRVLTETRPHLLPVMYARIYLLKAIEQVLHNALALLNISPVKQM